MFKQRFLTALLLVPMVLLVIYYANLWFLGFLVLGLLSLGAWEWTSLVPIYSLTQKVCFVVAVFLFLGFFVPIFNELLFIWLIVWIFMGLAIVNYPYSQGYWGHAVIVTALGLLLLPLFAVSLAHIYLLPQGQHLIVYLLCLVWAADTGAYLGGKCWGSIKLIPKVSPGKTIEGACCGFLLAMVVASIALVCFKPNSMVMWYLVAMATALISMLGDLLVSMLKRRSQIKDTGQIFPGHGGALDRLDSLIAAAPLFYCGLQYL